MLCVCVCVFAIDARLGFLHIQVVCMSLLTSNKFDSFDRFGGRKPHVCLKNGFHGLVTNIK